MLNKYITNGLKKIQTTTKATLNHLWSDDVLYGRTVCYFASKQLKQLKKLLVVRKYAFDLTAVVFVLVIGAYVFFPTLAKANIVGQQNSLDHKTIALTIASMENETKSFGTLPDAETAIPRKIFQIPVTAYSSDVGQTDSTPCITASGMDVCKRNQEDIVAANFLPIGTHIRIPELYGDKIFSVQDRMNSRYNQHMDIWMKSLSQAKQFGLKNVKVEVF